MNPYVSGGFGSGRRPQYQVYLATLAALLERSVRVVLTRQQMFSHAHRAEAVKTVSLGTDASGHLQAIVNRAPTPTSSHEHHMEIVVNGSLMAYACCNASGEYTITEMDIATPGDMRAPGAATGMTLFEIAMDEMACAAGVDPLEFRLPNYTDENAMTGRPFTSKSLRDAYRQGAERIGWSRRSAEPRSMRDGTGPIGMATGVWDALVMKTSARATLTRDGRLEVASHGLDRSSPRLDDNQVDRSADRDARRTDPIPDSRMTDRRCQPATGRSSDASRHVATTRSWVRRAVIGLNLCPFANGPESGDRVRYVASDATSTDALMDCLDAEMRLLTEVAETEVETTLVIHPYTLSDFLAFNDFVGDVEDRIDALGLEGVLQLATFHPRYRFARTRDDDLGNATNRSPYPTLQLLRESSVDRAVIAFPDPQAIVAANLEALERLGAAGWAAIEHACRDDAAAREHPAV